MKKIVIIIVSMAVLLTAIHCSAYVSNATINNQSNADNPDFTIKWDGEINLSGNIEVVATLPAETNVAAGDFIITYDKDKIICVSAEKHPDNNGFLITNKEIGNGTVRFSYVNTNPTNKGMPLIKMEFEVKYRHGGNTEITSQGSGVVGIDDKPIALDYVPETIELGKIVTEHSFAEKWSMDTSKHWKECECGARKDEEQHSTIIDPVQKATQTTDGKTEGSHCSVCETVLKKQEVIPHIAAVELSFEKKNYTGTSIDPPALTVKDSKGKILIKDRDYEVSGLNPINAVGKYYVNVKFIGNYEDNAKLYFIILPNVPATSKADLSTASGGYDDIKYTWDKVVGASGYHVYYKKSTSSQYTYLTSTTNTYVIKKNLSDGVNYYFKVVPYLEEEGNKYSSLSNKVSSVYTLKKIATPKISKSGSKVKVRWTNIPGESGYQISKSTKKTGTSIVSTYATTKGTYKLVSATKGKSYYYKVRAYKLVKNGSKTYKVYGPWSTAVRYKR